ELVFVSSFAGGEVFRFGAVFCRGKGKVFYFSPGDQEYPVYHQAEIQRVLANAVVWARPEEREAAPVKSANAPRDWIRADDPASAVLWPRPMSRASAPVTIATAPRACFLAAAPDGAARVI